MRLLCLFIPLDFFAVLFLMFGSEGGGYLTVQGGKFGLHLFFEDFFVVLEKLFEDIVDEVTDAAWRPVSGAQDSANVKNEVRFYADF